MSYRFYQNILIVESIDLPIIRHDRPRSCAGFDLDGTLIKPLPGHSTFDRSPNNWRPWNNYVVKTLQHLQHVGYQIVIFTNQGGNSLKTVTTEGAKNKLVQKLLQIQQWLQKESISVIIYAVLGRDASNRKPDPGMHQFALISRIIRESGLYCGDAAGRKDDHSDCDLMFARATGLKFFLPEEMFTLIPITIKSEPASNLFNLEIEQDGNVDADDELNLADPEIECDIDDTSDLNDHEIEIDIDVTDLTQTEKASCLLSSSQQKLIILVGYPGSGKTTYAETKLRGTSTLNLSASPSDPGPETLTIISQDIFKNNKRCSRSIVSVINDVDLALRRGESVVVDRTNLTARDRAPFLNLAKKYHAISIAYYFQVELELCYQRNVERHELNQTIPQVPKIVYYKMRKTLEPPSITEGFHFVN